MYVEVEANGIIKDSYPRLAAKERLTQKSPGIWLGPHIATEKPVKISSGDLTLVRINGLDDLRRQIPPSYRNSLETTMRSRYAQLGGEFLPMTGKLLKDALEDSRAPNSVSLPFVNHSQAPLVIDPGEICRVYSRNGPPIMGEQLERLINEGKIRLSGDRGQDWWVAKDKDNRPIGVGMLLDPNELWIPPRSEPVRPNGATTTTFRKDLRDSMEEIEPGNPAVIRIGETLSDLGFAEDLVALIDKDVIETTDPSTLRLANPAHIACRVLYGGYPKKDWPIKFETLSTLDERHRMPTDRHPKIGVVTFYKKDTNSFPVTA